MDVLRDASGGALLAVVPHALKAEVMFSTLDCGYMTSRIGGKRLSQGDGATIRQALLELAEHTSSDRWPIDHPDLAARSQPKDGGTLFSSTSKVLVSAIRLEHNAASYKVESGGTRTQGAVGFADWLAAKMKADTNTQGGAVFLKSDSGDAKVFLPRILKEQATGYKLISPWFLEPSVGSWLSSHPASVFGIHQVSGVEHAPADPEVDTIVAFGEDLGKDSEGSSLWFEKDPISSCSLRDAGKKYWWLAGQGAESHGRMDLFCTTCKKVFEGQIPYAARCLMPEDNTVSRGKHIFLIDYGPAPPISCDSCGGWLDHGMPDVKNCMSKYLNEAKQYAPFLNKVMGSSFEPAYYLNIVNSYLQSSFAIAELLDLPELFEVLDLIMPEPPLDIYAIHHNCDRLSIHDAISVVVNLFGAVEFFTLDERSNVALLRLRVVRKSFLVHGARHSQRLFQKLLLLKGLGTSLDWMYSGLASRVDLVLDLFYSVLATPMIRHCRNIITESSLRVNYYHGDHWM